MNCERCHQMSAPGDLICKYCGLDLRAPTSQAAWEKPTSGILKQLVRPPHLPDLQKLIKTRIDSASKPPENENRNPARCKYCGNEISHGSQFCPNCGKPVESPGAMTAIHTNTAHQVPPHRPNIPVPRSIRRKNSACLPSILVGIGTFILTNLLGFCGYSLFFTSGSSPTSAEVQNTQVPSGSTSQPPVLQMTESQPAVNMVKVKIASQSPLSGYFSVIGIDIKNGAELAVAQKSGPLEELGLNVQLVAFDDEGNEDAGVKNANQIAADPQVLCVIGHFNSRVQIAASEIYHAAQLANISPANSNPKVTEKGYAEINRIVGRDDMQGAVGAQFAQSKGIKKIFILHDETDYGKAIAEMTKQESEKNNIQVVGYEGSQEKSNFGALLERVLSANPGAIYFAGIYDQGAVLFKEAREKGFSGMCISDDGFDTTQSALIAGDSLAEGAGTYYSLIAVPASKYTGSEGFLVDFKASFGTNPQPFAVQGYDSASVCLKGIEEAVRANSGKQPTRAEVANAIRNLKDFQGITGTINFDGNGDLEKAKYFMLQAPSGDPNKWSENPIVQTYELAPPR
ncbi:MAG: ABC transporter substrate-binding protein [Anaerolineaceae bacterium]